MGCQVRPRLIDLKNFPTAILFSLLLCRFVASVSDTSHTGLVSTCVANYTETINNQTGLADDKYQVNLEALFNDFTTTSLSFYNTTAGNLPYKSYGMYLCRGDATSELCRSCVTNLTDWVVSFDANCTARVAYADYCMLRYANYSFFGKADDRSLGYMYDKFDAKISVVYNRTLEGVVEQAISDAAYNSTSSLFATSEAAVDEQEKVYALAQCTPDIDRGSCSACLKAAQSYLQRNITGDAKFAWAMLTSCQLRYDNASFFGVKPATSNPAPPPVSPFLAATLSLLIYGLI